MKRLVRNQSQLSASGRSHRRLEQTGARPARFGRAVVGAGRSTAGRREAAPGQGSETRCLKPPALVLIILILSGSEGFAEQAGFQMVVERDSRIQVLNLDGDVMKEFGSAQGGDNPICLPNGKGVSVVRFTKYGPNAERELFLLRDPATPAMQLTFGMNVVPPVSVDAQGERIAYVSKKSGELHVVDLESKTSIQLTTTFTTKQFPGVLGSPLWSPDSTRIAVSYTGTAPKTSSYHVVDVESHKVTDIPGPDLNSPLWSSWSPDSRRLAIGRDFRPRIVDVSTEMPAVIRDLDRGVDDIQWSPDGRYLAFRQEDKNYCGSIYTMDLVTGSEQEVSPSFFEYRCFRRPQWSPDGQWLAFFGHSSRGDMSPVPWPPNIGDQVYVSHRHGLARRITEDLGFARNFYGVSWCKNAVGIGH